MILFYCGIWLWQAVPELWLHGFPGFSSFRCLCQDIPRALKLQPSNVTMTCSTWKNRFREGKSIVARLAHLPLQVPFTSFNSSKLFPLFDNQDTTLITQLPSPPHPPAVSATVLSSLHHFISSFVSPLSTPLCWLSFLPSRVSQRLDYVIQILPSCHFA